MQKDAKIYIAGHRGLVGSALERCLTTRGYTNVVTRSHQELDLTSQPSVEAFFRAEKPEYVFLAAAKVGGIWANNTYPAEFSYTNLAIQTNVLHAAWKYEVDRLIFLGSSCIYPRECPQPIKEEYLLTGPLELTNEPYALAKIAGISQCQAYNRQYGTKFLAVMPTNLYGPNDNFDLATSHVLPALIRKLHLAKLAACGERQGIEEDEANYGPIPEAFKRSLSAIIAAKGEQAPLASIQLWGTGSPRREFLHVDDMADACVHLINLDDSTFKKLVVENPRPMINIGCGEDLTIQELSALTAQIVGYRGDIGWDRSKPDGTPRKLLHVDRLQRLGWKPRIALAEGIEETYRQYLKRKNFTGAKQGSEEDGAAMKIIAGSSAGRFERPLDTEKTALITGITGQDGAYLAEFLLAKGYTVHGIKRRASHFNTQRVDHLYQDPHQENRRFILHYGDLTDATNLIRIIQEVQPDEIYNLGAQSHVKVSFESAEYTANTDALGTLRLLEAIRILGLEEKTRFYQASTSELYGKVQEVPQTERTPFYPRSPYSVAKLYGYWITVNYREAYRLFACNGILFNHESPLRGETFVTRKITRAAARIALGLDDTLYLGNLDARRDWGHAKDFVRAQWLILQQDEPDDYVIATGEQHSVRECCQRAFGELGIKLDWQGRGVAEQGIIAAIEPSPFREKYAEHYLPGRLKAGQCVVQVDPAYFRPTEVETLLGDPSKAREKLHWSPEVTFEELIFEMVAHDLQEAARDAICERNGFVVPSSLEVHM